MMFNYNKYCIFASSNIAINSWYRLYAIGWINMRFKGTINHIKEFIFRKIYINKVIFVGRGTRSVFSLCITQNWRYKHRYWDLFLCRATHIGRYCQGAWVDADTMNNVASHHLHACNDAETDCTFNLSITRIILTKKIY